MVVDPHTNKVVSSSTGLAGAVSVQQAVQLCMFAIVNYAVELALEYGIIKSFVTVFVQLIQGGHCALQSSTYAVDRWLQHRPLGD
jgi:hypothetical protein